MKTALSGNSAMKAVPARLEYLLALMKPVCHHLRLPPRGRGVRSPFSRFHPHPAGMRRWGLMGCGGCVMGCGGALGLIGCGGCVMGCGMGTLAPIWLWGVMGGGALGLLGCALDLVSSHLTDDLLRLTDR